jgi:hypothetical protein
VDQGDFARKDGFKMGLLLSKTLSKIILSVGPFSAVLVITSSFQVYFGPIDNRSECLYVLL